MTNRSIFRRTFLLVVTLLGLHYFTVNIEKLVSAGRFHEQLALLRADSADDSLSIEQIQDNRVLRRDQFYSPFCTTAGYRFYVLPWDVRLAVRDRSIRFRLDGSVFEPEQAFIFDGFVALFDAKRYRALLAVHGDHLESLALINESSRSIVAAASSATPSTQIFLHEQEIEVHRIESSPDPYSQSIMALPPLAANKLYSFTVEYRSLAEARPYLIAGEHPVWFVHEELSRTDGPYRSVEMTASPSRDLRKPVLILRNWGREGTAFFKRLRVTEREGFRAGAGPYVNYDPLAREIPAPQVVNLR